MSNSSSSSTIIPKQTVMIAAEALGIELSDDVIKTLCQDVEYRLREITQVLLKC